MRGVYAEVRFEISCLNENFTSLYLRAVQQGFEIKFPTSHPLLVHCYTLNCDFTQCTRYKPWKCVFFSHCYWTVLPHRGESVTATWYRIRN